MEFVKDLDAALESVNAGAPIATIDPYLLEQMWGALSRIRREVQQPIVGMVGARLDPEVAPRNPEQKLAMTLRYVLLNALIEAGVLDDYMSDEALRKKVFTTAALLPCDEHDLGEAVAGRVLRQSPAEIGEKKKEELTKAGYDVDHLKVADKFIEWLRTNC